MGQMPAGVAVATVFGPEQQTYTQRGPPWMCGQHNVRASAGDNTGQNTDNEHTYPRTEIKITDPAGNPTSAAGLEGRNPTDHATETDILFLNFLF